MEHKTNWWEPELSMREPEVYSKYGCTESFMTCTYQSHVTIDVSVEWAVTYLDIIII